MDVPDSLKYLGGKSLSPGDRSYIRGSLELDDRLWVYPLQREHGSFGFGDFPSTYPSDLCLRLAVDSGWNETSVTN